MQALEALDVLEHRLDQLVDHFGIDLEVVDSTALPPMDWVAWSLPLYRPPGISALV